MLHVALVGLLAGSLITGAPDGDRPTDDDKKKKADQQEQVAEQSVVVMSEEASVQDSDDPESITQDTFAFGRPGDTPIKLWVEYGMGTADDVYSPDGAVQDVSVGGGNIIGGDGNIKSSRAQAGVQLNVIPLSSFKLGVGAVVSAAKNKVEGTAGPVSQTGDVLESDFSVQNVKLFVSARGEVLGLHGGYMLDVGDAQEFTEPIPALGGLRLPTDIARSDNRNAINIGADFDYPFENVRLFGGIDYYWLQENEDIIEESLAEARIARPGRTDEELLASENLYGEEGDDLWNFMLGGGFRFSIFELGATAQIVTRMRQPVDRNGAGTPGTSPNIGGHVASISPYLRVTPGSLPAAIYLKGGVADEYNLYGYPLGGANGPKPSFGATVGIAIGFD